MGLPVEGSGMGGRECPEFGIFLHGGGAGGPTLQIGDMGDVSMHQDYSGRLSPPGDTPTDGVAAKTARGQEMGLPTIGHSNVVCGLGGGVDVYCPPPEHSCTVLHNLTHYIHLPGGGAAPWGSGIPVVVRTGGWWAWKGCRQQKGRRKWRRWSSRRMGTRKTNKTEVIL